MSNNRTVGPRERGRPPGKFVLSGNRWVSQYLGANRLQELRQPFRSHAEAFVGTLRAAGARVTINATYRPPERAYLMHWCWKIAKNRVKPEDVPAMNGVSISWKHYDKDDKYSHDQSVEAARAMVRAFQMERLGVAPSLNSRHTLGFGIDMTISWNGELTLPDAYGHMVKITSLPRTGMNRELHRVGASYGVVKYNRSGRDDPHWSDTGA